MGPAFNAAGAALALCVATSPALAAPAAGLAVSDAPGGALPEVVVTAQRREQSAQDVGIAISVLGGRELSQRGVTTLATLQYQTPGLEITPAFGGGEPNFRLRGVGFDDYASNNASPVGVYVDDVALPLPIQTTGQIFDVDRVEVLRGPQGTLYGRNTTGGALNILSNRPTETLQAGVDGEAGSYGYGKVEGYVSGAAGAGLTLRLAGIDEQGGGFQRNRATGQGIGDLNRYALRAQADWRPVPRLDARLEVSFGHDGSDGQGLYLFQPLATPTGVIPADADHFKTGWGGSPTFAALTGVAPDARPFRDNDNGGADLHLGYDLGFARLTSITAFHDLDRREYEDWDAAAAAFAGVYFRSRASVLSEELRLNSQGAGPLKWVAGVYYSRERLRETFITDLIDGLAFDTENTYQQHADTVAAFGQGEYRLTPRLNLTAGLRVEHERRELIDYTTATDPVAPLGGGAVLGVRGIDSGLTYTKPSGKLEADYRLPASVLAYASASYGVKSGGFSAYNTVDPRQLHPVRPETLWAYEGGVKGDYLDHRLRMDAAVYYYDYRDQQVQSAIETFAGAIGNIVNAPRSRIWGTELEVDAQPTPRLQVSQSVSYKRGEFLSFTGLDAVSGREVDRDGQDEGFPKLDYNGSGSYWWRVGSYRLTAQTDYSYRGRLSPVLLGPNYEVAAYWILNATLTLAPEHGPWSAGLYARNLTDTRYDLTRNFFTGDRAGRLISIAAPGAPVTVGGRVSYRY